MRPIKYRFIFIRRRISPADDKTKRNLSFRAVRKEFHLSRFAEFRTPHRTDFRLPVRGVDGFEAAQVTAGGLLTEGFDPETMQSKIHPGLFACGEVLDIDGPCGGYNLQWAWASGRLAGRLGA